MLEEQITITLSPPAIRALYLCLEAGSEKLLGKTGKKRAAEISAYLVARFPKACGVETEQPKPSKKEGKDV